MIALSRMRSIAGPERTACLAQAVTSFAPFSMTAAGSVAQGACGVDHVVDQDDLFALNAADDVHNLADVGLLAALVHDRQAASDAGREIARTCDGAQVGETTTYSSLFSPTRSFMNEESSGAPSRWSTGMLKKP